MVLPSFGRFWHNRPHGLFVPKPSTGGGCQGRCIPDLGRGVHCCPPASVVGRGGSYSFGYSAPARPAGGGRPALQVLGSVAAALDRLPRGAEQAASGKCCGKPDRKVAGDGVNAALHDRIAALRAATI